MKTRLVPVFLIAALSLAAGTFVLGQEKAAKKEKARGAVAIDTEDARVTAKIKPVGVPQVYNTDDGRDLRLFVLKLTRRRIPIALRALVPGSAARRGRLALP